MARKSVLLSLKGYELGREERALSFIVNDGTEKVGELELSRGGFRWYPRNSKGSHHHLTWDRFAKLVEENIKKTT